MSERPPAMEWSFLNEYLTKEAEFKDASRNAIIEELGFAPNLKASIVAEIQLRSSVRRLQNKEISQETFDTHLAHVTKYVRIATDKWNLPQAPLKKSQTN